MFVCTKLEDKVKKLSLLYLLSMYFLSTYLYIKKIENETNINSRKSLHFLFLNQFPLRCDRGYLSLGIFSWSLTSNLAFWNNRASSSEAEEADNGPTPRPPAPETGWGTVVLESGPTFSPSSKSSRSERGSGKRRIGSLSNPSCINLANSWSKKCFISRTSFST